MILVGRTRWPMTDNTYWIMVMLVNSVVLNTYILILIPWICGSELGKMKTQGQFTFSMKQPVLYLMKIQIGHYLVFQWEFLIKDTFWEKRYISS